MLDYVLDAMDRPGRVLLGFIALSAAYTLIDAAYITLATGVGFFSALFVPAAFDLFARLVVLVLALIAAIAGELLVSRYRATARQLESERNRLNALYENNPSAIISLGPDMTVTYANKRAAEIIGKSRAQIVGRPCYEAIIGQSEMCDGCLVSQVFESGTTRSRIKHEQTVAGRENWLSQVWYPLFDDDGRVASVVEIASDVSELKLDPLTQLPNRVLLRDRLDVAVAAARRHHQQVAVLFMDIDGFKDINDTRGHLAGDMLLINFAERLRGVVRRDETLARISGDEFVLLVPALERDEDVHAIADRVLEQLEAPFMLQGEPVSVSASIGGCIFTGGDISAGALLDSADEAMYESKSSGGNRFTLTTCGDVPLTSVVSEL